MSIFTGLVDPASGMTLWRNGGVTAKAFMFRGMAFSADSALLYGAAAPGHFVGGGIFVDAQGLAWTVGGGVLPGSTIWVAGLPFAPDGRMIFADENAPPVLFVQGVGIAADGGVCWKHKV